MGLASTLESLQLPGPHHRNFESVGLGCYLGIWNVNMSAQVIRLQVLFLRNSGQVSISWESFTDSPPCCHPSGEHVRLRKEDGGDIPWWCPLLTHKEGVFHRSWAQWQAGIPGKWLGLPSLVLFSGKVRFLELPAVGLRALTFFNFIRFEFYFEQEWGWLNFIQ